MWAIFNTDIFIRFPNWSTDFPRRRLDGRLAVEVDVEVQFEYEHVKLVQVHRAVLVDFEGIIYLSSLCSMLKTRRVIEEVGVRWDVEEVGAGDAFKGLSPLFRRGCLSGTISILMALAWALASLQKQKRL